MRFHLLGLAHLPAHIKYTSCAFTQKNHKMAKMLTSLGHEVFFYGCEGSDVEEYCDSNKLHFVQTHTLDDLRKDYGDGDNRFDIGYNWQVEEYRHDLSTNTRRPSTLKFLQSCTDNVKKLKKEDDFLLCTQGQYHRPVANEVKLFLKCESGIGYRGSAKEMFRCFESGYIQNFTYGSETPFASRNGSYYDRVIPNYFDPNEFEYDNEKEDYFLFIGRMIKRKGVLTAYLATKHSGDRLIFAGQNAFIDEQGNLKDKGQREFTISPDSNWEFIGFADVEKRKKLMSKAKGVFVATEYLEPFGGVSIEAMLSGTPAITTNFGCFPTNIPDVLDGKVGFRCNTLQDFVDAVNKCKNFTQEDYYFIRKYAERFLMDNVKYEFEKWFKDLYNVYESATIPGKRGWSRVEVQ